MLRAFFMNITDNVVGVSALKISAEEEKNLPLHLRPQIPRLGFHQELQTKAIRCLNPGSTSSTGFQVKDQSHLTDPILEHLLHIARHTKLSTQIYKCTQLLCNPVRCCWHDIADVIRVFHKYCTSLDLGCGEILS